MAIQGTYLVYRTVEDINRIRDLLAQVHDIIDRTAERADALPGALTGFVWPEGYTEVNFTSLVAVLKALPDSVVTTSARDAIFKLVSTFV
jgi:hypothetical protein